jgi:exodeoxyribonuclease V alpha subunit
MSRVSIILEGSGALPPLAQALAALLQRVAPEAPASLLQATRLLVALESRGHTVLPLHDGGRAACAEAGFDGAALLPADAAAARRAWAGCALVEIDPADESGHSPLVLQGVGLALRRHWRDERRAAGHLRARLSTAPPQATEPGAPSLEPLLDALFPPRPAVPGPDLQRQAALRALQGRITLITGGPGTGKTWTAARVLVLLQALHGGPAPLRMALAAPTGKAAARLRQSIDTALEHLRAETEPRLVPARAAVAGALAQQPARTLHATLGRRPGTRRFVHDGGNPLAVDLLLVDEASMVHGEMLAALLQALPAAARLVLLGDRDQLASVEAGAVMAELCAPGSPLAPQTVTLQAGHRFVGPIADLATAVNAGDADQAEALLAGSGAELALVDARSPEPLVRLAAGVTSYGAFAALLRQRSGADAAAFEPWLMQLMQAFDSFRLLTALREGPFGSVALNARLTEALGHRPGADGWYEGRPVMVTRNEPALDVFNGDVGVAITPPAGSPHPQALRVWFFDGARLRSVAAARLSAVETAYALTVHKSQGSEFAHVALVLPANDAPVLTRELVYTGITRARQRLTLVAPRPALLAVALQRRTRRFSGLAQALSPAPDASESGDRPA